MHCLSQFVFSAVAIHDISMQSGSRQSVIEVADSC